MPPSKKRSMLTCSKYRALKSQRLDKPELGLVNSTCSSVSVAHVHSIDDASPPLPPKSFPSIKLYSIVAPSKGFDLSIIRSDSFDPSSYKQNIASIISRASQFSFIDFVPESISPRSNDRTSDHCLNTRVGVSMNQQSTITSFLSSPHCSSTSIDPRFTVSTSSLLIDKSRCLVEDFMLLPKDKPVIILLPKLAESRRKFISNITRFPVTQFGTVRSTKYYVIKGFVKSNVKYDACKDSLLTVSEVKSAFSLKRNNGYGVTIQVSEDCVTIPRNNVSKNDTMLIKWIDVLNGGKTGIQVWSKLAKFRDFSSVLNSHCSIRDESNSHLAILTFIHQELWSDKYALMFLLSRYYMVLNKKRREQSIKLNKGSKEIGTQYKPNISDFNANSVNSLIEKTFLKCIKECYTDFTEINSLILSTSDISMLVNEYKLKLPEHYLIMKNIFGYDKKEKMERNNHLVRRGYYDRVCFYQYLVQSRVRWNHTFTYWGIINTCSVYGKNGGKSLSQAGTFFGNCVSMQTLMNKTKEWRDDMSNAIFKKLETESKLVCCLDNNQKGHNLKYQRFGKSNKYVKVTGTVLIKYNHCLPECFDIIQKMKLTYTKQMVPSPFLMPHFEQLYDESEVMSARDIIQCILEITKVPKNLRKLSIYPSTEEENVDFSGKRVEAYVHIAKTVITIDLVRTVCAGVFTKTGQQTKFVKYTPTQWKTDGFINIFKYMKEMKNIILNKKTSIFQHKTVQQWNPDSKYIFKSIVPKVFMYDEMTTDGYGMCIVELMSLHGILTKTTSNPNNKRWQLTSNWQEKTMLICLDGLSLDRHRGFKTKLCKMNMKFTDTFEQTLQFQKALTRVMAVSGPLHMAFHMLQVIFDVYRHLLSNIQLCLGWKKINMSKVSQNYRVCLALTEILYEEIFVFSL